MPEPFPSLPGAAPTPARKARGDLAASPVIAWIAGLPVRCLDMLLWLYQRTLSPALVVLNPTCGCRFAPTCSHYARTALLEHGLFAGVGLTLVRLAKCGPWHPGGSDPVPARPRPVCLKVSSPS